VGGEVILLQKSCCVDSCQAISCDFPGSAIETRRVRATGTLTTSDRSETELPLCPFCLDSIQSSKAFVAVFGVHVRGDILSLSLRGRDLR
jgi:hypothetical protein